MTHISYLLCLLVLLSRTIFSAVVGIDFSSELNKISAVVPGRSFDIVLDEASKRIHPSLIVFDDDVRRYGTSATSLISRRPLKAFLQFSRLLGKPFNTSLMKELNENYIFLPTEKDSKRNTVRFLSPYFNPDSKCTDNESEECDFISNLHSFSVEEISAMKLKHIRTLASKHIDGDAKDCVITVPEYWSMKERQSLLDSAQLAGMNVLGLINENTAAALQYALKREYEVNKTELIIFYNMGATSIKVNLVRYFANKQSKKRNKKTNAIGTITGAFEVLFHTWDETLGGNNFDRIIAKMIIERACSYLKTKAIEENLLESDINSLPTNAKFTARIREAAKRAKKVLSSLKEAPISIEGIYKDIDFKTSITRDSVYNQSNDIFVRVIQPLDAILLKSGYNKEDIDAIVLIGGGIRVPVIRDLLSTYLPNKPCREDINGDEAMAFGAAFRAANLSSTFRVRHIGMDDISSYAVGVRLADMITDDITDDSKLSKRGSLFMENNHLFRRRAVALKHCRDIKVKLFYEQSAQLPMDTSHDMGYFTVEGIADACEQYINNDKYNITDKPKISLSFLLDYNSIVSLVSATATFTEYVTEEKNIKKVGNESESNANKTENSTESDIVDTSFVTRKISHKKELQFKYYFADDVRSYDESDFAVSTKILLELDDRDRRVRETSLARNDLESYIFESRSRVYDDKNVDKVSTDEERESFLLVLEAGEEWIWEVEEDTAGVFKTKLRELKKHGSKMFMRADEVVHRPSAIEKAGQTLGQLLQSVDVLRMNYTWINSSEIDTFYDKVKAVELWLNGKIEEQDEKSLKEEPAFYSYQVFYKIEPIVELAKKLLSRPKPYDWDRKQKKKSENATKDSNDSQTEMEYDMEENVDVEVDGDGEPIENGDESEIDVDEEEKDEL